MLNILDGMVAMGDEFQYTCGNLDYICWNISIYNSYNSSNN